MNNYIAFGIPINSDIVLPSLEPCNTYIPTDAPTDAALRIRRANVSIEGIEAPIINKTFTQIKENQVWFNVPTIARFMITNGDEVTVDPYPDVDDDTLAVYILGSCMGAILHQRGLLVLHANAIRISDDDAILFVGDSGAGKSTTAAQFFQHGYQVLSDDVVAIDSQGGVVSGLPYIKLWQHALESLKIPHAHLKPVRANLNKYQLPLPEAAISNRPQVTAIYNLKVQPNIGPGSLHLSEHLGVDRFTCLTNNVYRADAIIGLSLKPQHLKKCSLLAQRAYIAEIRRPSEYFCAPEMMNMVLDDLHNKQLLN